MWYRLMSKHESEWPCGIPKRDGKEGVFGCNSITHTGSDHELSRQSIYESISYHDTILGRVWEGGGRGDMDVVV